LFCPVHFGLAAEKLNALGAAKVGVVVVGDDVAVGRKTGGLVGRRGLAGTVLSE
jgi:dihydroxyacetone kinase